VSPRCHITGKSIAHTVRSYKDGWGIAHDRGKAVADRVRTYDVSAPPQELPAPAVQP
jgi:hypothetical protein